MFCRILQPLDLLPRVAAERVDDPPEEEHMPLVKEPLPNESECKIALRFASQQLNGVGAATAIGEKDDVLFFPRCGLVCRKRYPDLLRRFIVLIPQK